MVYDEANENNFVAISMLVIGVFTLHSIFLSIIAYVHSDMQSDFYFLQ